MATKSRTPGQEFLFSLEIMMLLYFEQHFGICFFPGPGGIGPSTSFLTALLIGLLLNYLSYQDVYVQTLFRAESIYTFNYGYF